MAGACNDCGAAVADGPSLAAHAQTAHPGHPRLRFWDGKREILYSPDGTAVVELISDGIRGDRYVRKE